jgi:hypothetical protein
LQKKELSDEVPQKEEESKDETEDLKYDDEEMRDDGEEAAVDDWAGMEKRIKNLEDAIADLKSKVGEKNMEEEVEMEEEVSRQPKSRTIKEEFEVNEQLK